jgi:hypothetical protein
MQKTTAYIVVILSALGVYTSVQAQPSGAGAGARSPATRPATTAPQTMSFHDFLEARRRVLNQDADAFAPLMKVISDCRVGGAQCKAFLQSTLTPVIAAADKLDANPDYAALVSQFEKGPLDLKTVNYARLVGWRYEKGSWSFRGAAPADTPSAQPTSGVTAPAMTNPAARTAVSSTAPTAGAVTTLPEYLLTVPECQALGQRMDNEVRARPGQPPFDLNFFEAECLPQLPADQASVTRWRKGLSMGSLQADSALPIGAAGARAGAGGGSAGQAQLGGTAGSQAGDGRPGRGQSAATAVNELNAWDGETRETSAELERISLAEERERLRQEEAEEAEETERVAEEQREAQERAAATAAARGSSAGRNAGSGSDPARCAALQSELHAATANMDREVGPVEALERAMKATGLGVQLIDLRCGIRPDAPEADIQRTREEYVRGFESALTNCQQMSSGGRCTYRPPWYRDGNN